MRLRAWWQCARHHARIVDDRIGDVLNVTLYYRGGWVDVRVVDAIMVLGGVACVAWAYLAQGWRVALQAGAFWLFVTLCMLWFFSSDKKL